MTRGWLREAALVAVTAVATLYGTLVVADVVLGRVEPGPRRTAGLYRPDADRGYAMNPNFRGEIVTTQTFSVATNAAGYRDDEWDRTAPVRVLVAGDSFTFGEPLPVEQGFVRKAQTCQAGTRFYNAGVSGYGVAQVLPTIARECPALAPQHVFYMYYLNDTHWDEMDPQARTAMDGYIVQAVGEDRRTRLSEAELRAKVAAALAPRRWSAGAMLRLEHVASFLRRHGAAPPSSETADTAEYSPAAAGRARDMIVAMRDVARRCGGDFTMVVLPSAHEVASGVGEPATARLLGLLEGSGVDVLDLRRDWPVGAGLHLSRDRHLNAAGTDRVARQLLRHLRARHPELGLPEPR